jgi:hypothetical protein
MESKRESKQKHTKIIGNQRKTIRNHMNTIRRKSSNHWKIIGNHIKIIKNHEKQKKME